jgi:DNA-binding response OmpR family regulator
MKPRRVLVVEPDALLRALMAEWLERGGIHAVFPPAGPCEQSAQLGSIGTIVIDIPSPPHAGGAVRAWRRVFPDAQIIAASARFPAGADADDAMAGRLAVDRVLPKPFSRRELFAALGVPGRDR